LCHPPAYAGSGSAATKRVSACIWASVPSCIDLANGAGIQDIDVLPNTAGGGLNVTYLDFGLKICQVHKSSGRRGMGPKLTQQPQPLWFHLGDRLKVMSAT
jgi:hypothetical protein